MFVYFVPAYSPQIDGNTGYRTKCMLTMPILDSKGHSLAVMQFLNKNGGVFSREDFDMLRALCAQTSMAIQVFDYLSERNQRAVPRIRVMLIRVIARGRGQSHESESC